MIPPFGQQRIRTGIVNPITQHNAKTLVRVVCLHIIKSTKHVFFTLHEHFILCLMHVCPKLYRCLLLTPFIPLGELHILSEVFAPALKGNRVILRLRHDAINRILRHIILCIYYQGKFLKGHFNQVFPYRAGIECICQWNSEWRLSIRRDRS